MNNSRMTSVSFTVDDDLITETSLNSTLRSQFKGLKPFSNQYGLQQRPLPNRKNKQILERAQMDAYRQMNQELFNPFEHKLGGGFIRKESDLYEIQKKRQLQQLKKKQQDMMNTNKNYTIVFHNDVKSKHNLQMAAKNVLGDDGNAPVISDYYNQKFKKKPMDMIDEDQADHEEYEDIRKTDPSKSKKKVDNFVDNTKKVQKKPVSSSDKNYRKASGWNTTKRKSQQVVTKLPENKGPNIPTSKPPPKQKVQDAKKNESEVIPVKIRSQNVIRKDKSFNDDIDPLPITSNKSIQKKPQNRKAPPSRPPPQPKKQIKKQTLPRKPQIPKANMAKKPVSNNKNKSSQKKKYSDVYEGPDRNLVQQLERQLTQCPTISFDDIAQLQTAKNLLQQAVLLPRLMPQFFQGIRKAMKGILLFGPPGTGKTLLAKAIAKDNIFLNVSASSLASKWKGQSQKMVRLLFQIAKYHSPSVIFFDQIDAIGSRRSENQHESNRKVKTQLLVQMDGVGSNDNEVFVLAATNRPWDLDQALRRRLQKRIYIPLPGKQGRRKMFDINLKGLKICEKINWNNLVELTKGCSGADICNVCRDAAYMPIRRKLKQVGGIGKLQDLKQNQILDEEVSEADLIQSCKKVKPSVGKQDLKKYEAWMNQFGST